jgi:hypothetical protein
MPLIQEEALNVTDETIVQTEFDESSDEGRWITLENGNHILLKDDGTIASGKFSGKTLNQAFGDNKEVPTTTVGLGRSSYSSGKEKDTKVTPEIQAAFDKMQSDFWKDGDKSRNTKINGKSRNAKSPVVTTLPKKPGSASDDFSRSDYSSGKEKNTKITPELQAAFDKMGEELWGKKKKKNESALVPNTVCEFDEAVIPSNLTEKSIQSNGTARIRIIKPGWGSSGYYSEQMLERDASKVYTYGLHMYLDHPTSIEEKGRPERSIKDLAAVIEGNVRYEKDNPDGAGVYADAHVFKPYRGMLKEMAPYIGLSHRAQGKSKSGQAEGRSGSIIESLDKAYSVDFVTLPGAGGGLVQMYESWREPETDKNSETNNAPIEENKEDIMTITLKELKETRPEIIDELKADILKESQETESVKVSESELEDAKAKILALEAECARLKEKTAVGEAAIIATEALKDAKVPNLAKPRILDALVGKAVLKEGVLDIDAFNTIVEESIKTETDYYGKIMESGKVRGMGAVSTTSTDITKALKESFKEDFIRAGKSLAEAEKMAEIAATGR